MGGLIGCEFFCSEVAGDDFLLSLSLQANLVMQLASIQSDKYIKTSEGAG